MVKRHYYDGLTFHRVIKGFMIQTGDVKARAARLAEYRIRKTKSTLRSISRSRACWQWRTRVDPIQPRARFSSPWERRLLDGMYTIFGQVVSGQDVADRISQVPTVRDDKPLVPVIVKSVTIQRKQ